MKVAVVGAGAIGGLIGGRLAERGAEVTLVGRAAHVEAIRERGLVLEDSRGERVVRVRASTALEERPDLTLLATKTQSLAEACEAVAPLVGDGPVVTMQNGVRCDEIARRYFAPGQIVGCVVYSMASFLEPGRVGCQVRGYLAVGDPFGAGPRRLETVADALRRALPVRISKDIRAARWTKLIGNLNNALPAATGLPLQEIYFSPTTSRLPLRLMREGLRTLSAAGARTDRSPQAVAMRLSVRLPERLTTSLLRAVGRSGLGEIPMFGSTWQSIVRGSPTEVDYLNGEIVALGGRAGVPTPYNARVVRLVHEVERSGRFFPPESLWPETGR